MSGRPKRLPVVRFSDFDKTSGSATIDGRMADSCYVTSGHPEWSPKGDTLVFRSIVQITLSVRIADPFIFKFFTEWAIMKVNDEAQRQNSWQQAKPAGL